MKKVIIFTLLSVFNSVNASQLNTLPNTLTIAPLEKLSGANQLGDLSFKAPTLIEFNTAENGQGKGVPVIFAPITELPVVEITVLFKAGSVYDEQIKQGAYGMSFLTANLLTKSTAQDNEEQFLEKVDELGAKLVASNSKDYLNVNLAVLSEEEILNPALDLMINVLKDATFPEEILDREKEKALTHMRIQLQNPTYLAEETFAKTIFANHPYANPHIGTKEGFKLITPKDLVEFKNTFLVYENAAIVITGNIDENQAKNIANKIANQLNHGNIAPDIASVLPAKPQHIHIVYPGKQTQFFLGKITDFSDVKSSELEEKMAFELANSILADRGFSSYLMKELRLKHSYTYGISGHHAELSKAGVYFIHFSTQNKHANEAIKLAFSTIHAAQEKGFNEEELALTKNFSKYRYPNLLSSNRAIHQLSVLMAIGRISRAHLENYFEHLDNVTLEMVNQSLRSLNLEDFVLVSVGLVKPDLVDIQQWLNTQPDK